MLYLITKLIGSFQNIIEGKIILNTPLRTNDDGVDVREYFTKLVERPAWQSTPIEPVTDKEVVNNYPRKILLHFAEKKKITCLA